jgi:predicted GNAT family N-acyltransferase
MIENIKYNDSMKDLPIDQLYKLFDQAGWVNHDIDTKEMYDNFNLPFINSTLVISAWDNDKLVGTIRVLSDKIIRSVIYDLVVDKEYQHKGIGKTLIKKCIEKFPDTDWLVETTEERKTFYEQLGFIKNESVILKILSVPSGAFMFTVLFKLLLVTIHEAPTRYNPLSQFVIRFPLTVRVSNIRSKAYIPVSQLEISLLRIYSLPLDI